MNLYDMLRRGDNKLIVAPGTSLWKSVVNGKTWRGLSVSHSTDPQVTIPNLPLWYPFSTRPETVGWYARCGKGQTTVTVRLQDRHNTIAEAAIEVGSAPTAIPIPWPMTSAPISDDAVLTLWFDLEEEKNAHLLVHKSLDRTELIALARGTGVEIGPGSKPQVLNGPGVSARYVEEMPADRWRELYDTHGQYNSASADWSQYIVGKASALPVEDDSLDFIFSSHVFEHLANPLGHLERWSRKLKSGGVVLAIVPDVAGTKDYRQQPCSLEEIISERNEDIWEPQRRHYERWAGTRGGWSDRIDEAMAEQMSIHVHFYTRENMASLLRHATQALPFSGYHIRHTPNHRDFYWILIRE